MVKQNLITHIVAMSTEHQPARPCFIFFCTIFVNIGEKRVHSSPSTKRNSSCFSRCLYLSCCCSFSQGQLQSCWRVSNCRIPPLWSHPPSASARRSGVPSSWQLRQICRRSPSLPAPRFLITSASPLATSLVELPFRRSY